MRARKAKRARLATLRSVSLFADCTDDELLEIDRLMTEVQVAEGERLMGEGQPGREFVIISEGTASVQRGDETVYSAGPGAFVGELALLDHKPRNATVTATSSMRAYIVNTGEFGDLMRRAPALREKIERTAAQRRE